MDEVVIVEGGIFVIVETVIEGSMISKAYVVHPTTREIFPVGGKDAVRNSHLDRVVYMFDRASDEGEVDGAADGPPVVVASTSNGTLGIRNGRIRYRPSELENFRQLMAEAEFDQEIFGDHPGFVPRISTVFQYFDLLIEGAGDPQGLHLIPKSSDVPCGGLHEVLQLLQEREDVERAERDGERRAAERQREFAENQRADDRFINPYNFVPLPESVHRTDPPGHDRLHPSRKMGRIEVVWKAKTPLLFGNGRDRGLEKVRAGTNGGDSVYRVAGSSLKGAVRSLHEAVTGSCLRVTDLDFAPVYREPASVHRNQTMAVVTELDRLGRPLKVRLCSQVLWCPIEKLATPHTGMTYTLDDVETQDRHGRTEIVGARVVPSDVCLHPCAGPPGSCSSTDEQRSAAATGGAVTGSWVVLVTDTKARRGGHPWFFALGQIGTSECEVTELGRLRWEEEAEGSDDLRVRADGAREFDPVQRPALGRGDRVGFRLTIPRHLEVGDVVWVESNSGQITRLSASSLWRTRGDHTAPLRDRIGDAGPCGGPKLCPSCRIFGAAETDGVDLARVEQKSYRGNVRISHGVVRLAEGAELEERQIPPRGAPRAGAGQFYLRIGGAEHDREPETSSQYLPNAAWGSRKDKGTERGRPLRGRKFYWHSPESDTPEGVGRWSRSVARAHQVREGGMGPETVHLLPPDTTVSATLWFENLDDDDLASLLLAVQPSLLLNGRAGGENLLTLPRFAGSDTSGLRLWAHLGGGKPLGLGSVEVDSVEVHLEEDRYSERASRLLDEGALQGLVGGFLERQLAASGDGSQGMLDRLRSLVAMLDHGRVNPARVAYPPGATWDRAGTQEFDRSFKFFGVSKGGSFNDAKPVTPLPDPTDDPSIGIPG